MQLSLLLSLLYSSFSTIHPLRFPSSTNTNLSLSKTSLLGLWILILWKRKSKGVKGVLTVPRLSSYIPKTGRYFSIQQLQHHPSPPIPIDEHQLKPLESLSLELSIQQLPHHPSPPIPIDEHQLKYLENLSQNVTFLLEFLETYRSPVEDDDSDDPDPLGMRIADAAHAAEDVIESRIVDTIQRRRYTSYSPPPAAAAGSNYQWKPLMSFIPSRLVRKAIKDMDLIKKDVMKMKKEKSRFVEAHVPASGDSSSRSSVTVGLDDVILEVLDKLTGGHSNRRVIPIVGMGGIGKTFLAMNVFENQFIKEHFDICAWATISQHYNTKEILCALLSQANGKSKEELSYMGEDELELELHQYLSYRRFLIVLDDMWSVEAWEKIQRSFPDNNNSSRIVVTTRLSNLASRLDSSYCLEMKFLDKVSSWDLFSKFVFGEGSCPTELEEVGKGILESCGGLPLAIVVVGGLLKKMERTVGSWESIRRSSSSVVNSDKEEFCLKILKLSYNHLPVHLKPCFLYMGVFEEDREIRVSTLIKLWVSEGFLKPISGKSLEMAAKDYLNDLVDRNLILVHELGSTGNIKFCKLHDLLRDLCWREAKKEGFYSVVGPHNVGLLDRQRRVVIPRSTSKEVVPSASRSFICDNKEVLPLPELRLLRTLKAYDRDASGSHDYKLEDVFKFVNLRYLAVGVHRQLKFPSSLRLLWNLQTLIIFYPSWLYARDVIWTMPQLRHVEIHKGSMSLPPFFGDIVFPMENLQTLKGVTVYFLQCDKASKIIPNIKKLGVSGGNIPSDLACLSKLESFRCWNLRQVNKCTFPYSLRQLSLGSDSSSHWEVDEWLLNKIGALPLLEKLKLERARFHLERWETSEGQFPSLKFLKLKHCLLESWITESTHFPRLERLYLWGLKELEEIPAEIGEISTLQSILLEYCSESVVESAKNITEEQDEVQVRVVLFNSNKNQALRRRLTSTPNFIVEIVSFELHS